MADMLGKPEELRKARLSEVARILDSTERHFGASSAAALATARTRELVDRLTVADAVRVELERRRAQRDAVTVDPI